MLPPSGRGSPARLFEHELLRMRKLNSRTLLPRSGKVPATSAAARSTNRRPMPPGAPYPTERPSRAALGGRRYIGARPRYAASSVPCSRVGADESRGLPGTRASSTSPQGPGEDLIPLSLSLSLSLFLPCSSSLLIVCAVLMASRKDCRQEGGALRGKLTHVIISCNIQLSPPHH